MISQSEIERAWADNRLKWLVSELRSAVASDAAAKREHWMWAQLSEVEYELRNYDAAAAAAQAGLDIRPECPLLLWDLAGALRMLGRPDEAESIWLGLIAAGDPAVLADDDCWEDEGWARRLQNDARFRLAQLAVERDEIDLARRYLGEFVIEVESGCSTIVQPSEQEELVLLVKGGLA